MKEGEIITNTQQLLKRISSYIDKSFWREKYLFGLKSLQEEISSPCVLAVAGKVKAGKSFLVNSLLGVDLAMTGSTETTATINIFKKGKPLSKDKPVLCQYIDGSKEWKSMDFLDTLQGTSEETLKITSKIDKLIFYIDDNPILEEVTLVDTPGIGADVGDDGDSHQIQTDSYFKLRKRHQQDTINLSNNADAIIYIFNTVPTETDKEFLASLYDGGQGITALNGIGVLSKIDKELDQIKNVPKFTKDFEKELFTIMPTSAAISKYLPTLESAEKLKNILHTGFSSEKGFKLSIGSETAFLHEKLPDCLLSVSERKQILKDFAIKDLPWSTFALVAKELYYTDDLNNAISKLNSFSGMAALREIINNHFFCRNRLLRCHKILLELKCIMTEIQYDDFFMEAEHDAKIKGYCLAQCNHLDNSVKEIVYKLINKHIPSIEEIYEVKNTIISFKDEIDTLNEELAVINDCYLAFQKVISAKDQFFNSEISELNILFSGKEIDLNPAQRQKYWSAVYNCSAPNSVRQIVADVAKTQYNKLANN